MDKKRATSLSKFLSLVLRHEPQAAGVTLDAAGWVDLDVLLAGCAANAHEMSRDELLELVRSSDKQRFALSDDQLKIRANQGHSVEVQLDYPKSEPPEFLYHGTVDPFIESIREKGLLKGDRHDVHLSETTETAAKVGQRRGKPAILTIRANQMCTAGHEFRRTPNGVWLTEWVPPQFIDFPVS